MLVIFPQPETVKNHFRKVIFLEAVYCVQDINKAAVFTIIFNCSSENFDSTWFYFFLFHKDTYNIYCGRKNLADLLEGYSTAIHGYKDDFNWKSVLHCLENTRSVTSLKEKMTVYQLQP